MLEVVTANMSLSKQQFAGKLAKKNLDFAKTNLTFGCRNHAEISKI